MRLNTNSDSFIQNKPTIPDAQQPSDWDARSGVTRILNKPTIPDAQIQSDWDQTDTAVLDYIKNKPNVAIQHSRRSRSRSGERRLRISGKFGGRIHLDNSIRSWRSNNEYWIDFSDESLQSTTSIFRRPMSRRIFQTMSAWRTEPHSKQRC